MIKILPAKKTFIENAESGKLYALYAELPYMQPRQAYESVRSRHSFLLESIKGPDKISRYSFIGAGPFLIYSVKNGITEMDDGKQNSIVRGDSKTNSPLNRLKDLFSDYKIMQSENLPPFPGGAVGLISYDFVHYFEKLPVTARDTLNIPDAHFMFIDTVIAIDNKLGKTFFLSCPGAREAMIGPESSAPRWSEYYDMACEKMHAMYDLIMDNPPAGKAGDLDIPLTRGSDAGTGRITIHHEMGKETYMDIVQRTKEYIKAGDIFQANLSQRVSAHIENIEPWQIYKILSRINPAPFAAYLDMGNYCIASSSPERLVRVAGNVVETRPIAGTRPRGRDAEDDKVMTADLLLNEKERAEHLMLIDLERNDLGKISDYSSVEVDELMITEEYSHVIHIVSNVRGTLATGRDCFDAIRATFPGGTITGVPKVRCMEIIDELEPIVRGPYTGSIGYIGFNGSMDLNIVIRSFVMKDKIAYVQAGAGIVADSDPEKEYYETLKKAEALIKTLEML
jgi:anthranilate/para-aminobenzoate synthase component I